MWSPPTTNLEKQAEFIEEYETIKAGLGKNDSIHFMDASHPTHNTTPSYGWIKKGKAGDKFIPTNMGRARLNLHGALNLENLTTTMNLVETVNSQTVLKMLNLILAK